MIIAISKGIGPKYDMYAPWLAAMSRGVETVELSSLSDEAAVAAVKNADGIVFTGGPDIDPICYKRPEFQMQCKNITEDSRRRDQAEMRWFELARNAGIPLLCVCRGMQLANVIFGGTLIPHLSNAEKHVKQDGDREHNVRLEPTSILSESEGNLDYVVNSSHHQALDEISPMFRVTARAPDGTVEAVEWMETDGKPFFLGVQWHPERMSPQSPMSSLVAKAFLLACGRQ
jgi:putative glutamine amidotransferase